MAPLLGFRLITLGRPLSLLAPAALLQAAGAVALMVPAAQRPVENLQELENLPFSTDLTLVLSNASASRADVNLLSSSHSAGAGPRAGNPGWPVALWLHIHKSGGTFMCAMARLAGERVVQPSDNCNLRDHDGYADSGHHEIAMPCEERADWFKQMRVSWAQIERELWESDKCWNDFLYGVMLREPLSLMRSMMNYHPDKGKLFVKDIVEQLQKPGEPTANQDAPWKFMDNFQTRVLASAMDVPAGQISEEHLVEAVRVLSRFDVVARLEDLPNIAPSLFAKLGWPPALASHVGQAVNPSRPVFDFTSEEESMLRYLNKFDYAIYNKFVWTGAMPPEPPAEALAEPPAESPTEAPAEAVAEAPAEAPTEAPAEVPAPAGFSASFSDWVHSHILSRGSDGIVASANMAESNLAM